MDDSNMNAADDEYLKKNTALSSNEDSELLSLRKEKLKLDIVNTKLLNYKLQLELYEKEKALGIAPSDFTKDLH